MLSSIDITSKGWRPFKRWLVTYGFVDAVFHDKRLAINFAGMQLANGDWDRVFLDGRPIAVADSPAL